MARAGANEKEATDLGLALANADYSQVDNFSEQSMNKHPTFEIPANHKLKKNMKFSKQKSLLSWA